MRKYQNFIDEINGYLDKRKLRRLLDVEADLLNNYLNATFEIAQKHKRTNLMSELCIEASKFVCEIHPGLEEPTVEQISKACKALDVQERISLNDRAAKNSTRCSL
jgi:hypothetical protein